MDWCNLYREAILLPDHIDREIYVKSRKIQLIATDFAYQAKLYAKIIIGERSSPGKVLVESSSMGGAAGGTKFVAHSIFFKLLNDHRGIYGSKAASAKAGGLELLSLNSLLPVCPQHNIWLPITCIVDYLGMRVLATAIAPIDKTTLKYGSSDGGKTLSVDKEVQVKVEAIAQSLNLASHPSCGQQIHLAADVEIHSDASSNLWLLDAARVWPPEDPLCYTSKCSHLINRLRPEFVIKHPRPLSSDAFSRFGSEGAEEFNDDIKTATNQLWLEVIPKAAAYLDDFFLKGARAVSLAIIIHGYGINLRHLGAIYACANREPSRSALLLEMLARCAKELLRAQMRRTGDSKACRTPIESVYRHSILQFLNQLFGDSPESLSFWEQELIPMIRSKFSICGLHVCSKRSGHGPFLADSPIVNPFDDSDVRNAAPGSVLLGSTNHPRHIPRAVRSEFNDQPITQTFHGRPDVPVRSLPPQLPEFEPAFKAPLARMQTEGCVGGATTSSGPHKSRIQKQAPLDNGVSPWQIPESPYSSPEDPPSPLAPPSEKGGTAAYDLFEADAEVGAYYGFVNPSESSSSGAVMESKSCSDLSPCCCGVCLTIRTMEPTERCCCSGVCRSCPWLALKPKEAAFEIRKSVSFSALLSRLLELVPVEVSPRVHRLLLGNGWTNPTQRKHFPAKVSSQQNPWLSPQPFREWDILDIHPRLKEMTLLPFADGFVQLQSALSPDTSAQDSIRLLEDASMSLQAACESSVLMGNPSSSLAGSYVRAVYYLGVALFQRALRCPSDGKRAVRLLHSSKKRLLHFLKVTEELSGSISQLATRKNLMELRDKAKAMCDTKLHQCARHGCAMAYSRTSNHKDACRYHLSPPRLISGNASMWPWPCCRESPSSRKGCGVGWHRHRHDTPDPEEAMSGGTGRMSSVCVVKSIKTLCEKIRSCVRADPQSVELLFQLCVEQNPSPEKRVYCGSRQVVDLVLGFLAVKLCDGTPIELSEQHLLLRVLSQLTKGGSRAIESFSKTFNGLSVVELLIRMCQRERDNSDLHYQGLLTLTRLLEAGLDKGLYGDEFKSFLSSACLKHTQLGVFQQLLENML